MHVRINEHDPKAGIEQIKVELKQLAKEKLATSEAEKTKLALALLTAVGVIWASS